MASKTRQAKRTRTLTALDAERPLVAVLLDAHATCVADLSRIKESLIADSGGAEDFKSEEAFEKFIASHRAEVLGLIAKTGRSRAQLLSALSAPAQALLVLAALRILMSSHRPLDALAVASVPGRRPGTALSAFVGQLWFPGAHEHAGHD